MATTDDFSGDINTTGLVTIGTPIKGQIETVGDKDWFKVTLTKGSTYIFDLAGAGSGDGTLGSAGSHGRISLYDSTGTFKDSIFNGGTGGDPRMTVTPTESGTYFLEASDLGSGTGSYTLKSSGDTGGTSPGGTTGGSTGDTNVPVTTTSEGSTDIAGNSSTTATLAVATQASGKIGSAGDTDWYKVTLQAGTTYVFDLSGAGGAGGTLGTNGSHGRLSIYNNSSTTPLESTFNGGTGGDPKLTYTPTASGTYYLEAADIGTGTGTYTLKWTSPTSITPTTPTTPSTPGPLTPDTAFTGTDAKDNFNGSTGDNIMDGKGGIDTVTYLRNRADYTITLTGDNPIVQANLGLEGTDTLMNIERLQFADKKIAIDVKGNALYTFEFISTVAPAMLNNLNARGFILTQFDQKATMLNLSQMALDAGLLPSNSKALGDAVYNNLFGHPPSESMSNALKDYIDYYGNTAFISTVAGLNLNIDLVGLQKSGMEYA